MTCFWITLILFAIFVIASFRWAHVRRQASAWNRVYGEVARRLKGRLKSANSFAYPLLRVPHGESTAQVGPLLTRDGDCTQVLIDRSDESARIELATRGLVGAVRMRQTQVRELPPAVAGHWELFTDDSVAAQHLLNSSVAWQLERLRCLDQPSEVYVGWLRGKLFVRRLGFIRDPDTLEELVRAALDLHGQARLTRAAGIEFVSPLEAQLLETPTCQVCGEAIRSEMVLCRRCRTPHCRECWEYTVGCSTFACGETRFVVPQVATPLLSNTEEDTPPKEPGEGDKS